jgi:hypothetical protein
MTNGTALQGPKRKLPIVGTIVTAYWFCFRHVGPLARAAAVPFIVTLIADLRLLWAAHEQHMMYSARLFWFLLPFIATIPFATQCHRYFLEATPASRPRFGFPWSRRETSFMLHAMGLFGLMFLLNALFVPLAARFMVGPGSTVTYAIGLAVAALLFAVTVYIAARFALVLPAAAIGRNLNWAAAWQRATGHGVGLALIVFLAPLPWLIPSAVHMVMGPDATEIWRFVITTAIIEACGLVSTATSMIALAAAYRWIVAGTGALPAAGA